MKFMCALGNCKWQCETCKMDEKCDADTLLQKKYFLNEQMIENAKNYAKELVEMYMFILTAEEPISKAKHCACIAIDQVIRGNFGDGYNHQFYLETKRQILNQ